MSSGIITAPLTADADMWALILTILSLLICGAVYAALIRKLIKGPKRIPRSYARKMQSGQKAEGQ